MRIFLILSLILFVISFIVYVVGGVFLTLAWPGWMLLGFISYVLNHATNEWRLGPPIG